MPPKNQTPPRCKHTRLDPKCRACQELKSKWYGKLREKGFSDIEYGLENPRFLVHTPDPTAPGADEAREYYERVWAVYHSWMAGGRSKRDCRVAELLAAQDGVSGTVRGISDMLKREGLRPWGTERVQITLKEIQEASKSDPGESPMCPVVYLGPRHA